MVNIGSAIDIRCFILKLDGVDVSVKRLLHPIWFESNVLTLAVWRSEFANSSSFANELRLKFVKTQMAEHNNTREHSVCSGCNRTIVILFIIGALVVLLPLSANRQQLYGMFAVKQQIVVPTQPQVDAGS